MKTKQVIGIASGLVFAAVLCLGIAVAVILYLGSLTNKDDAGTVANTSSITPNSSNESYVALYNNVTQEIVRVNMRDGSSQNFSLGLPLADAYISGRALSSDGRLLAYCAVERQSDGTYVTNRLIVRDLPAAQDIMVEEFGNIPGCNASAFSPDNSRVAVGLVFNSAITNENNFPDEPDWALRIFDVNSGEVVQELTADSPIAPDFGSMSDFWFEPGMSAMSNVLYYGNDSLYFVAYPFVGRDGPPAAPAFRWDFASNNLSQIEGLGNSGAAFLAETGEIAYPYLNPAYTAAQAMGPVPQANEIVLQDASGSRTVYRDEDNVIASLGFVNGGRQLAVLLLPNANPDNPEEVPLSRYILLNRDSTVENLNSASAYFSPVFATSTGFGVIRIEQHQNAEGQYSNLHQILRYDNGDLVVLWEYDAPAQGDTQVWMSFFGATPPSIAPDLPPFASVD